MKLFKLYTLLIVGLMFASCRPKPIDIQVDSAPSKMVVFSHAVPGNYMIIGLSKSFSLLDGITEDQYNTLLLSGATVQVTSGATTYNFTEISPGFYASLTPVQQTNESLHLTATHGDETVTATTNFTSLIPFSNVQPIVDKTPTDTTVHIQMDFTDELNVDNWYMINVYKKNDANNSQIDGVNFFANGSNLLEETILLSDKEFDGNYSEKKTFSGLHHEDSVVVTLSNISQEYFNYLSLRSDGGNVFNSLNLEPLNYPTNINNGYGFFNAHYPDVRFYDLGEF